MKNRLLIATLILAAGVAVVTTGATLLGLLGGVWWGFDLLSHFQIVYALVQVLAAAVVVIVAVLAAGKIRRGALGGLIVAAVGLGVNLWLLSGAYSLMPIPGQVTPPRLRVLLMNVHVDNPEHDGIIDTIREGDADVVVLLEFSVSLGRAISFSDLMDTYTQVEGSVVEAGPEGGNPANLMVMVRKGAGDGRSPRTAVRGLAGTAVRGRAGTRVDVLEHRLVTPSDAAAWSPGVELRLAVTDTQSGATREVMLLAIHPPPPMRASWTAWRDEMLAWAGQWAKRQTDAGVACIVVGDLNATPWCHGWDALVEPGGLVDTRWRTGVQPTWPANRLGGLLPPLIPIDHILISHDLRHFDRRTVPIPGSDHLGVLCEMGGW